MVLRFNNRVDERIRRKNFIKERNLLSINALRLKAKKMLRSEVEERLCPLARFHSEAKHRKLLEAVNEQIRLETELKKLQVRKTLSEDRSGVSSMLLFSFLSFLLVCFKLYREFGARTVAEGARIVAEMAKVERKVAEANRQLELSGNPQEIGKIGMYLERSAKFSQLKSQPQPEPREEMAEVEKNGIGAFGKKRLTAKPEDSAAGKGEVKNEPKVDVQYEIQNCEGTELLDESVKPKF